jgi:hypothetical protein
VTKIAGSGSESICQRYGSADPDPDPDPYQNFMDPQHCLIHICIFTYRRLLWYGGRVTVLKIIRKKIGLAMQISHWGSGSVPADSDMRWISLRS